MGGISKVKVALLASAWIEIKKATRFRQWAIVALLASAWIEIL